VNRFFNLLAVLFVAPEFLVGLICLGTFYYFEYFFEWIGKSIRADAEVWKYLPALPLVFSTAAFNFSSKIRAPLENLSNKILYEWNFYQLLVDRVYVGFFYAIFAGFTAVSLWFFGQSLSYSKVGVIFIFSVISSGVTALTMLMAQQKLRELIEKYS
jgi:hypothetical protein